MVFVTRYLGGFQGIKSMILVATANKDARFVLGIYRLAVQYDLQNIIYRVVGVHYLPYAQ